MMSAAQYYPKLLSIMGNVLRFLPAFVRMKALLEEGYVGDLLVCEAQVRQHLTFLTFGFWGNAKHATFCETKKKKLYVG